LRHPDPGALEQQITATNAGRITARMVIEGREWPDDAGGG
jgi:glutamate dehydrogenase/leucine dehydrogenase